MWNDKTVSVIFPCYNEEKAVFKTIHDFYNTGYVDEIIVIDNNSTDRSAELVMTTEAKLISEKQQGYGFALQRGLAEAEGDLVIMAEPDGTFLAKDIIKLLAYADDCDMVLGTRTKKPMIKENSNMGLLLRSGNWLVAKMLEFLFNMPSLSDCGCTMRLIRRPLLNALRPHLTVGTSHFLPEMVILGQYLGAKMIEIPINYSGRVGTSKITGNMKNTIRVAFNMIGLILYYRIRFWLGLGARAKTKE